MCYTILLIDSKHPQLKFFVGAQMIEEKIHELFKANKNYENELAYKLQRISDVIIMLLKQAYENGKVRKWERTQANK